MPRLNILSDDDLSNFYQIPKLEEDERPFIFELEEADINYLNSFDDIAGKIHYILLLGYFRASQYLFNFTFQAVRKDVWHIIKTYFPDSKFPKRQVTRHRYYSNRKTLLEKYEIAIYTSKFENKLKKYLQDLVRQHIVPKYLFDSLLDYCHRHQIVRPNYSTLQKLISKACNKIGRAHV